MAICHEFSTLKIFDIFSQTFRALTLFFSGGEEHSSVTTEEENSGSKRLGNYIETFQCELLAEELAEE